MEAFLVLELLSALDHKVLELSSGDDVVFSAEGQISAHFVYLFSCESSFGLLETGMHLRVAQAELRRLRLGLSPLSEQSLVRKVLLKHEGVDFQESLVKPISVAFDLNRIVELLLAEPRVVVRLSPVQGHHLLIVVLYRLYALFANSFEYHI